MKKGRSILLFTCLVILSGQAFGQARSKPNFSGSWIMDLKKSKAIISVGGSKNRRFRSEVEIEHNDPELKLTKTTIAEELDKNGTVVNASEWSRETFVYYTDGRSVESPAFGKVKYHTTTKWSGDMVVVRRPEPQLVNSYMEIRISLAKDGTELSIVTEHVMTPTAFGQSATTIDQFKGKEIFVRNEEARPATSH